MIQERDPAFSEYVKGVQENSKKQDALIAEYEENKSLYANRQAVFNAAHLILDATDIYTNNDRIKKWSVVLAAHGLNGDEKIPKPSKKRFNLSESEIEESKAQANRLILAIKAAESLTMDEAKKQAETPADIPDPIIEEAKKIYESGKFTEYSLKTFEKVWYQDQHIFRWLLAVFANNFVENTKEGLHLYVCGPSGLGKSESVKVFLSTVPEEYLISGSFSKKSILYTDGIKEGALIFQDDHIPTDDEAEIIRAILSSWSTGFIHHTVERVDNENRMVSKNVPKRLTKILTNADAISRTTTNGQDESRYVCIEFKRTIEEMRKIILFDDDLPDISHEIQVIKEVWRLIAKAPKTITIPFKITVNDEGVFKIREFKRFKTLIKALVLLDNRTTATKEDFIKAIELWSYILVMIDNESAGAKTPEQQVLNKLIELSKKDLLNEVYISDLCAALPTMKGPNIYRYIRGRSGTFENPTGGILTMVPGIIIKEWYNKVTQSKERIIKMPKDIVQKIKTDVYLLDNGGITSNG